MFFLIYKVTNLVNNKIYIGCHKTENVNDDYMGSGTLLRKEQSKFGIENFEKEILEVFDSSEEMFEMEAKLVNSTFVKRDDTYNLKEGGRGGFDHIHSIQNYSFGMKGKNHSESTKKKMSESAKVRIMPEVKDSTRKKMSKAQSGSNNPAFGTMWIHHLDLKESKKIHRDEFPEWEAKGWIKGRKLKFN